MDQTNVQLKHRVTLFATNGIAPDAAYIGGLWNRAGFRIVHPANPQRVAAFQTNCKTINK